jgi:serine/threonine-protein kinase
MRALTLERIQTEGLAEALIGQVLPGNDGRRYPLRERLGEGGHGWIFRARWNGSIDVVVKVLRPDSLLDDALARFRREAQVLRMLSQQPMPNPHIVRFYDHACAAVRVPATGESWQLPFTVLELVDGETAEQALERARPHGLGLDRARRVLRHVALALKDVHECNIVHRDLKPSNILLADQRGHEIAKVTDFGIAKMLGPGLERTMHLAGATVGYAPPEQFEDGNLRVGKHTDVFSLAAIFYELVSGLPAFPIHTQAHPLMVIARILNESRPAFARVREHLPRELAERPDVIAALDAELFRALSPEPSERHASVVEMHDAIERALAALVASPSVPKSGPTGDVVVQAISEPRLDADDAAIAPTVRVKYDPRVSIPDVGEVAGVGWRRVTSPLEGEVFTAIAVSADGERAIAAGPRRMACWHQNAWKPLAVVPVVLAPSAVRAAAWIGDSMIFAGGSSTVMKLDGMARPTTWTFDEPNVVFHAAFADEKGIVLGGKRVTPEGATGVVAEIVFRGASEPELRLVDLPGCTTIRSVARLVWGVVGAGDGGMMFLLREGKAPRITKVCERTLRAVQPAADGAAFAVGDAGFAFRVWPKLQVEVESTQTKRDLFALACGTDGTMWCGGAAGRLLRRDAERWTRVGGRDQDVRVRALHASEKRVRAFCDNGSVLEGLVR